MRRWIAAAAAALTIASPGAASRREPVPSVPELLIVGSPHLANHFRDMANTRVTDVTVPARQREIDAVIDRLAAFRPTRIAVEWPSTRQDSLDRRYADYRAGRYKLTADEVDQIGLRLAARLNLPRVDAVDWNEEPP